MTLGKSTAIGAGMVVDGPPKPAGAIPAVPCCIHLPKTPFHQGREPEQHQRLLNTMLFGLLGYVIGCVPNGAQIWDMFRIAAPFPRDLRCGNYGY